jgi:DNA-binding MarR family transcriptional regulator
MTIVDLLRGVRTPTIALFGLDRHSRFGELREMDRTELARLAESLLDGGLVESSATLKPVLRLTPSGAKSIRNLTLNPFNFAVGQTGRDGAEDSVATMTEQLLRLRDETALQLGISPLELCGDSVVQGIARNLPTSRASFLAIEGTTDELFERFGAIAISSILDVVTDDGDEQTRALPERLRRTYRLASEGYSLTEIAERSALHISTVSNHLEEIIDGGVEIDVGRFVPQGILKAVREELASTPRATLRELRALLGGGVDIPELRIAASWARRSLRESLVRQRRAGVEQSNIAGT